MNKSISRKVALLIVGLLASTAWTDAERRPGAAELCKRATASAGYVQNDFVGDLKANLAEGFDDFRADRMIKQLAKRNLRSRDAIKFMNGLVTRRELVERFGVRGARAENKARKAVDKAVDQKNRKIFFGILLVTLVGEYDVDPTSEFCKQIVAAKDEMKVDDYKRIFLQSRRSTTTIGRAFKLRDREDQTLIARVLDEVARSDYLSHPFCASMPRGKVRANSNSKRLPKLVRGMSGFDERDADTAGGMQIDKTLPPLPIMSKNVKGCFGDAEDKDEDE